MPTKITIKINYIKDLLLFTENNNIIKITKKNTSNNIEYQEYVYIDSLVNNTLFKKEYFIMTNYYDNYTEALESDNFIISFNSDKQIFYEYNYSEQTIYLYYQKIDILFEMIGLVNYNKDITVLTISNLNKISGLNEDFIELLNLKNNILKNNNLIFLPGDIVSINNLTIVDGVNITFNYYLFETNIPIIINDLTKIYFYDPTFIRIINIPINNKNDLNIDAINVLVELKDSNNSLLYSYITNLNFNKVDSDKMSSLVLSFKNYVNTIEFSSITLKIFDYDYYIYFSDLVIGDYIKCKPIEIGDINLYDILIGSNSDIPIPTILDLNIEDYNTNLDQNELNNILSLNKELISKLIENFLFSDKERFLILLDYLVNFKINNYNLYDIKFINEPFNSAKNGITYLENELKFLSTKPNNLMLNSILTNIEIFFKNKKDVSSNYNIYGMIFNNNITWDIYIKKYQLDNPSNKYALIKDLMIIAINFDSIVIYNYSDIDDFNTKIKTLSTTGIPYINTYYRYNRIILNKSNCRLIFGLDENFYLKLYFEINIIYKMLIFYSDTVISSNNTKILNFKTDGLYYFKIYQISKPNGSVLTDKYQYSILFQNIEECNDFLYFINNGTTIKSQNIYSTYYNIPKSKLFVLDSEGYYVVNSSTSLLNTISFTILNLDLSIGNVYVNNNIIQT